MTAAAAAMYCNMFNSQPHIDDVCYNNLDNIVDILSEDIERTGVSIGLTRAHKHFDLQAGEVCVVKQSSKYPLEIETCKFHTSLTPVMWIPTDKENCWLPVLYSHNTSVSDTDHRLDDVFALIWKRMNQLQVIGEIGLCSAFFPMDASDSKALVEYTNEMSREQRFVLEDLSLSNKKPIQTVWMYSGTDPDGPPMGSWAPCYCHDEGRYHSRW